MTLERSGNEIQVWGEYVVGGIEDGFKIFEGWCFAIKIGFQFVVLLLNLRNNIKAREQNMILPAVEVQSKSFWCIN